VPAFPTTAFDRVSDALKGLDFQLQALRDQIDDRRQNFREDLVRRAQDVQDQLQESPLFKRAEAARKTVEDRVDNARSDIFERFGLASKADVAKLSKKLNSLNRKLNELTKLAKERQEQPFTH